MEGIFNEIKKQKLVAGLLLTSFTLATALTGCGGDTQQAANNDGAGAETITFTCADVMSTGNNVSLGDS